MDLSRRGFLCGLAGAAAVAVLAVPVVELVARETLPRIVGDGIHDDTAGLQAAIDSKPFIGDVKVIEVDGRRTVLLGNGEYRISKAMELVDVNDLTIDGGTLVAEGDCAVSLKGICRNLSFRNFHVKLRPRHINPTARAMQISYGGAV